MPYVKGGYVRELGRVTAHAHESPIRWSLRPHHLPRMDAFAFQSPPRSAMGRSDWGVARAH